MPGTSRNIQPSELKFGFIGLGNIGCGIVKNLLNTGHKVTVWNRNAFKVINHLFNYLFLKLG